ncbi:MAG: tetratricopeptide repeat protein [bacterium]
MSKHSRNGYSCALLILLVLILSGCNRKSLSQSPVSTATPSPSGAEAFYPGKISIIPVGPIDDKTSADIKAAIPQLERLFRHNIELTQPVALPPSAYHPVKDRYHALILLKEVGRKVPEEAILAVAVTAKGLYSEGQEEMLCDFRLGNKASAVISIAPIAASATFPARLKALMGEAIARALGLPFCAGKACLFGRSVTVADLDQKGTVLCKNCEALAPLLLQSWIFSQKTLDAKVAAEYQKISQSSSDPWAHLYLASLYSFFKLGSQSADELMKATDLAGSDPLARFEAAWGAYQMGAYGGASNAFSALIKGKVLIPESLEGKAECALSLKKTKEALDAYKRLLKEFPAYYGRALALRRVGEINLSQKNYASAEEALKASLKLNPRDIDTKVSLANIYLLLKKPGSAVTLFKEIQVADPANEKSRLGLAYAFKIEKKYDEAIKELAELLYSNNYRAEALFETAWCFIKMEKYDDAVSNLETLINEFPSFSKIGQAHQIFGDIMVEKKDLVKAGEEYGLALKNNPRNATALSGTGRIMALQGRDAEALACLNKAVALDPGDLETLYILGMVYKKAGKTAESVATFRKALRINPGEFRVNLELGSASVQSKDYQAAVDYLKSALKAKSDSKEALIQIAVAYESLKRYKEERAVLEKFFTLAQGNNEFQQQLNWATERLKNLPVK